MTVVGNLHSAGHGRRGDGEARDRLYRKDVRKSERDATRAQAESKEAWEKAKKELDQRAKKLLNEPKEINLAIAKPAENINQMAFLVYDEFKIPLLEHYLKNQEVKTLIRQMFQRDGKLEFHDMLQYLEKAVEERDTASSAASCRLTAKCKFPRRYAGGAWIEHGSGSASGGGVSNTGCRSLAPIVARRTLYVLTESGALQAYR